jgi:unsaturated rhamnogalacturonyl hydrolase
MRHSKGEGELQKKTDEYIKLCKMNFIVTISLLITMLQVRKEKTVLLDSYFNNEYVTDSAGTQHSWHYKWDEYDNGGFSLLADVFKSHGVATKTSFERPSRSILQQADIYIIVDPDIPKENPHPNYIEPQDIEAIYDWVKAGGVLVMMGNDTGNAEFDHFNLLASRFGIQFNRDSRNKVIDDHFETGAISIDNTNVIFKTAKKIYLKDISTLKITKLAKAVLTDKGDVIMAIAKVGKGTVFAVGDPWLYNEYTDGKKLPSDYENYNAAKDLVNWLVRQIPVNK